MFQVNEVIQLEDKLYRVLLTTNTHAVWISIDEKKSFPDIIELSQLKALMLEEKVVRVEDPYEYVINLFPELDSKVAAIRDRNYQIIKPIVEDPNFYIKVNIPTN